MRTSWIAGSRTLVCLTAIAVLGTNGRAGDREWTELGADRDFGLWKPPTGEWLVAGGAVLDPKNPKLLKPVPGEGVMVNGPTGKTRNLVTKENYGDVEVHLEFLVPKGSNSGIKLEGLYEIQISDAWGIDKPKATDCGGIYPRAELLPKYRHIDEGFPPRLNATRPPGEWQTLDIIFQAPRFDDEGKKVASARFVKVALNGRVVQDDVEIAAPTGHAWTKKEVRTGPLFLQADHGPVAFRNVRVRPWKKE